METYALEDIVAEAFTSGINTELLVGVNVEGATCYGVRLRTFGKQLPKDRMILAQGATFEEAANVALEKSQDDRWEALDWSARPWKPQVRLSSLFGQGTASSTKR